MNKSTYTSDNEMGRNLVTSWKGHFHKRGVTYALITLRFSPFLHQTSYVHGGKGEQARVYIVGRSGVMDDGIVELKSYNLFLLR
jgi:hypothetical protein